MLSYYGKLDSMICKIEDYLSPKIYLGHEIEIKLSGINEEQIIYEREMLKIFNSLV